MASKTLKSVGRRRLSLFVLAILAPAVGLIVLGSRTLSQQRVLTTTYLEEERSALVEEIGERLLVRLESIRLEAEHAADGGRLDAIHPSIRWVGDIRDGRLVFPWDPSAHRDRFLAATSGGAFGRAVAAGERAEFESGDVGQALRSYQRAATAAADSIQSSYALLLQARALRKSGRPADELYLRLLDGPHVYDEFGIPLGLYAASALAGNDVHDDAVASYLVSLLQSLPGPGKPALDILRRVADELPPIRSGSGLDSELQRRERIVADAELASTECSRWGGTQQARWVASGASTLVCTPVNLGGEAAVLAVDVTSVLEEAVRPEALAQAGWTSPAISSTEDDAARSIAAVPGLALTFEAGESDAISRMMRMRTGLLGLGLLFLVGVALTGTVLLWRDVRREMELSEMRSQFVSSVSHELKTPLTAIRMFAETIRLRDPAKTVRDEYLDTIINESERLTRLLSNVLDFSKMERGAQQYQLAPTRLQEVVSGAARAMAYAVSAKGLELEADVDDGVPEVMADRDGIEQATLNLLANAVKYSDAGRPIRLRLQQCDGDACISVEDQGVGIREAERDRIFDRFYRADTPENRRIPGTGLGLALVKHVAEGHGGRVSVKSRRGQGSCFTIHLPLSNSNGFKAKPHLS